MPALATFRAKSASSPGRSSASTTTTSRSRVTARLAIASACFTASAWGTRMWSSARSPGHAGGGGEVDTGVAHRRRHPGQRARFVVDLDHQIHRHAAGSSRRGAVILAHRRRPSRPATRRRAGCGRPVPSRRARRRGWTSGQIRGTGSRSRSSRQAGRAAAQQGDPTRRAAVATTATGDPSPSRVGVRLSGSEARAARISSRRRPTCWATRMNDDPPQRARW